MQRNPEGRFETVHGMNKTKLHRVWSQMKQRCFNENDKAYCRYGARGISVCDEWVEFIPFHDWAMSNGYEEGLTIDRINNDGDYCHNNCRWVDHKAQNRNYSRNHIVEFNGERHCIKEWSEITGIKSGTILWRLRNGKPLEEVFSKGDKRFGNCV